MTLLAALLLTVLLSGPAAGSGGDRPESSTWLLEKSIQKQLAGRVSVPRYKSLAPRAEKEESAGAAAADDTKLDPSRHYISVLPSYYIGVQRHTLSRAECSLRGASMGAGYGLLLGALGTTTGLFDDDDAYYLIGGMTILGALLGGTMGPESRSFRTEWRWDAAKQQFDWREEQKNFNSNERDY